MNAKGKLLFFAKDLMYINFIVGSSGSRQLRRKIIIYL